MAGGFACAIVALWSTSWAELNDPTRKFPKCSQSDDQLNGTSLGGVIENTEAKAMGRSRDPAIDQVGSGKSRRIEDSGRAGPPRRISEANGADDANTFEEVAATTVALRVEARRKVVSAINAGL